MESLKIIGQTKDLRTNTNVLYVQINIKDYMELVGENYNKFKLQRRKEQHKSYERLKEDLMKGALLPTITLAVEPEYSLTFLNSIAGKDVNEIKQSFINIKDKVSILDGLQRTHKIKQIIDSGVEFNPEQKLLLEIWLEPEIKHLIYRLIVLNSGQKPMSMRHQIELLFATMRLSLSNEIPGLEILVENEEGKRKQAKQIPFERLVTAYKCFLTSSPEVDKDTLVSEKMIEEKILDQNEEFLSGSFSSFKEYLKLYCELDESLFKIYNAKPPSTFRNWFADANVINSFFAAIGKLHNTRPERIVTAINNLLKLIKNAEVGTDILDLNEYQEIRKEIADPKIFNVGFATRKLLTDSFNEYFRDEGNTSLLSCWTTESINIKNSKETK